MLKTLKYGQPHVYRLYNPTTGTYYLVRRRHGGKANSIQGKYTKTIICAEEEK